MNIAFFGASITQQKTGYVSNFKLLNTNFHVDQFGYGGMHIKDAGICFIDDVVATMPNYCFLDWFSPECYMPPECITEYLDPIIEKLLSINCHPIFLFFYRQGINSNWFNMFDYLKNYCIEYGINHIDLSQIENPDQYLRDSSHTNDLGSKLYGEIITKSFSSMIFPINYNKIPQKNKWSNIKSIDSNIIAKKYIRIISFGQSSIVGVLQKIGLYTENIQYEYNNVLQIANLKDRWSERYEREVIKFNTDTFNGEIIIKIPDNKQLIWKKIFYIGDAIQILDYE